MDFNECDYAEDYTKPSRPCVEVIKEANSTVGAIRRKILDNSQGYNTEVVQVHR